MQALKKAIISKFNATAALKSLMPGGLWDTEADQGSAYPYGVFQIISDVEDITFSDVKDNIIVQRALQTGITMEELTQKAI